MIITFSINLYDKEGDICDDEYILLHINKDLILKIKDMNELEDIIKQLNNIRNEIISEDLLP